MGEVEGKYYIYSRDAGQSEGEHVQVLPEGPLNTLVSAFDFRETSEKRVIALSQKPQADTDTPFDESYGWTKWLKHFDDAGQFSLTQDKNNTVQSFKFQLKLNDGKWETTFSSSEDVLKKAFGDGNAASIKSPGIVINDDDPTAQKQRSPLLCCALVEPTSQLSVTVEELFSVAGLSDSISTIPAQVRAWTAKLDKSNYEGKRNAMWFDPSLRQQTTVRLQFALDNSEPLRDLIATALPGFDITAADVTCRKILTEGKASKGLVAVEQGQVIFSVDCQVKPSNRAAVQMKAGIKFNEIGITVKLKMMDENALEGILIWLGEVIAGDLLFVKDLFHPPEDGDKSFEGLNLHQITIGLDALENSNKPSLEKFAIDFEVSGNFGKDDQGRKPVFLTTYTWMRGGAKLGSIRGQLWNSFDDSKSRTLRPYFEGWNDMQPFVPNPSKSLKLETLVPNQTVEIPKTVPSDVTRAFIVVSQNGVSVGATIETEKEVEAGDVPQPYLGLVQLDASYQWGKTSDFKFRLGIAAGIMSSSSSAHQVPALLEGELAYQHSG